MIDLMHAFSLIFLIDKSTVLKRNKLLLLLLLFDLFQNIFVPFLFSWPFTLFRLPALFNIYRRSPIFSYIAKNPFQPHTTNMATFVVLRHPVIILATDFLVKDTLLLLHLPVDSASGGLPPPPKKKKQEETTIP